MERLLSNLCISLNTTRRMLSQTINTQFCMFSKLYLLLLLILYYVPIVSQSHSRQEIFCTFWSTVIFNKKCYYLFPFGCEQSVTSSWDVQRPHKGSFHPLVSKLDHSSDDDDGSDVEDGVCSLLTACWVPGWHPVSLVFTTPCEYRYAHFTDEKTTA